MTKKAFRGILFILLISTTLFNSCSSVDYYVMNGQHFYTYDYDKPFQLDSFKVVKVIDNRERKNLIVGDATIGGDSLFINRYLDDYLYEAFSKLICKDTNAKNLKPVTISINKFYEYRDGKNLPHCLTNEYSYLFEYPVDSTNTRKIIIQDSNQYCNDPSIPYQRYILIDGIRTVARLFTNQVNSKGMMSNTNNNVPEIINPPDTTKYVTKTDSVQWNDIWEKKHKSGVQLDYLPGNMSQFGASLSYLNLSKFKGFRYEYGTAYGLSYFGVDNKDTTASVVCSFAKFVRRYHSLNDLKGVFCDISMGIGPGIEIDNKNGAKMVVGCGINFDVGHYFFNNWEISGGFYAEGFIGGQQLPFECGITISLSMFSDYSF